MPHYFHFSNDFKARNCANTLSINNELFFDKVGKTAGTERHKKSPNWRTKKGMYNSIFSGLTTPFSAVHGHERGLDFHRRTRTHHHQHGAALAYGFVAKIYAHHGICAHCRGAL